MPTVPALIPELTNLESEERHEEATEQGKREAWESVVDFGFEQDEAMAKRPKSLCDKLEKPILMSSDN